MMTKTDPAAMIKELRKGLKQAQAALVVANAERDAAIDLAERVKQKNGILVKANERLRERLKAVQA